VTEPFDEDTDHAFVEVRVLARDGLTHERDGEQDVPGGDVRPDMAAGSRRTEESVEGRLEVP
jgi:hypothetical protein